MPRVKKTTPGGSRQRGPRAAAIATAVLFLSAAGADGLPPTAAIVPPETTLLVEIDDLAALRQQFKKTSVYALYKDPAMAAFAADARGKWKEAVSKIENALVRSLVSAEILPEGRVALAAVVQAAGAKDDPDTIVLAQWGLSLEKIKQLIADVVRKAAEAGSTISRQDYRGVEITAVTAAGGGRTGKQSRFDPARTYYCFMDDFLICATDIERLQFAIAHVTSGPAGTLAARPEYARSVRAVGPRGDIAFYLNLKRIIDEIDSEAAPGTSESVTAKLGLDNVSCLAGSVGVARQAHSSVSAKSILTVNGPKKGILKMLNARTLPIKAPRFVPASAYSLSLINLDIPLVYDELHRILYSFSPIHAAMLGTLDVPEGPSGEAGLDFKRDVISHLGSQLVAAQMLNRPFSADAPAAESLLGVAVNDRAAVEKSLELLHSRLVGQGGPQSKRQLLGYTIYLVGMPQLMPPAGGNTPLQAGPGTSGAGMPALAFTVTNTHVLFGPEPIVERAIRTLSDPASSSLDSEKWFNWARISGGSVAGMAVLEDNAATGELFFDLARRGLAGTARDVSAAPGHSIIGRFTLESLDLKLLPQFEAVRKYFGPSVFRCLGRADGFTFDFRLLDSPPPQ
jgi:hypothetical protein